MRPEFRGLKLLCQHDDRATHGHHTTYSAFIIYDCRGLIIRCRAYTTSRAQGSSLSG